MKFKLDDFTRNDLEGIIYLLHGFYSQFVSENLGLQKALHCDSEEVIEAISLVDSLTINDIGELIVDEETWKSVKNDPLLIQALHQLSELTWLD